MRQVGGVILCQKLEGTCFWDWHWMAAHGATRPLHTAGVDPRV